MKKTLISTSIAVVLLSGCSDQQERAGPPPLYVSTFEVAAPTQDQSYSFKGDVIVAEQTPLAFRIAGEIEKVYVREGEAVKKGQLIAKLDDRNARQAVRDTKAKFDLAARQLARGRELSKTSVISKAELDELRANEQLARAEYALAQNQLKYTQLFAPFDGRVSSVQKKDFEQVKFAEAVVNLYQDNQVYVRVDLSDRVLAMLTSGVDPLNYRPMASFSGVTGEFPMTYLEHSNEPSQETGSYGLWLQMPQTTPYILPGTIATVSIDVGDIGMSALPRYQIPMTALQASDTESDQFYIWKVLDDDQVQREKINVMSIQGNGVTVIDGVSQGDTLVSSNLRQLRDGRKVVAAENNNP